MFEPSIDELREAGDLFTELLAEGKRLLRTPEAHRSRLQEQQDLVAQRHARAAALAMEKLQWRPQAAIAMINRLTCTNCHSQVNLFAGFGVLMHRNSDQSSRVAMTTCLDQAYPRETRYTDTATTACATCLPTLGFEVNHG